MIALFNFLAQFPYLTSLYNFLISFSLSISLLTSRFNLLIKFPYTNSQLLALCVKPTPAFLEEMYNMYEGLETGPVTIEEFKEKINITL